MFLLSLGLIWLNNVEYGLICFNAVNAQRCGVRCEVCSFGAVGEERDTDPDSLEETCADGKVQGTAHSMAQLRTSKFQGFHGQS